MSASSLSSSLTSLALASSTALFQPSQFFTNSFPSPTATSGNDNSGNNGSNSLAASSSLYLFTFLATLLLLLAVSCAIVVRSFIIRRRFHRRVQEALAEGVVLPLQPGQRRRDFGEKPKLWDAHLVPDEAESKWDAMMPVSVRVLSDKLTGAGQRYFNMPPRPTFLHTASFGLVRGQSWLPRFFRSRPPPPPSPPLAGPGANGSADVEHAQAPEPFVEDARLQVSVLIAMPSQYRPRTWATAEDPALKGKTRSIDSEDEELPDVVFGVAEVPWKISVQPDTTTPGEQPSSS